MLAESSSVDYNVSGQIQTSHRCCKVPYQMCLLALQHLSTVKAGQSDIHQTLFKLLAVALVTHQSEPRFILIDQSGIVVSGRIVSLMLLVAKTERKLAAFLLSIKTTANRYSFKVTIRNTSCCLATVNAKVSELSICCIYSYYVYVQLLQLQQQTLDSMDTNRHFNRKKLRY